MIVMDDTSNMVDVARYFMDFCMAESCGKCVPCRVGTYQMHEILRRIYDRQGTHGGLALLRELCDMVQIDEPVRAGADGAESGAVDAEVF